MSMISQLYREQADWALHYCTRTKEGTAFRRSLNEAPYSGRVALHHDGGDPENGLALHDLLSDVGEATLVYCCGPTGLMNAVRAAGKHLPLGTLHFENVAADPDRILAGENTDFVVELAGSGQVLNVPSDRTILEVLIENGIEVPHMCAEGYAVPVSWTLLRAYRNIGTSIWMMTRRPPVTPSLSAAPEPRASA